MCFFFGNNLLSNQFNRLIRQYTIVSIVINRTKRFKLFYKYTRIQKIQKENIENSNILNLLSPYFLTDYTKKFRLNSSVVLKRIFITVLLNPKHVIFACCNTQAKIFFSIIVICKNLQKFRISY